MMKKITKTKQITEGYIVINDKEFLVSLNYDQRENTDFVEADRTHTPPIHYFS